MWAMIPMFLTRSSATRVSVTAKSLLSLPAVVGEGLVGLRHAVHVVLALERVALLLERVEDLAGQLVAHVLLATVARVGDEPADRERLPPALRHLDRHRVLRAADADEHDRVLLEVVPLAGDVRADLDPVREPDARDLPQGRVRLLRGHRRDARADAAPLRRALQRGSLRLLPLGRASLANQLVD